MIIRYHPEAPEELLAGVRFYQARVRGLGAGFREQSGAAIRTLQRYPELGAMVDGDCRRFVMTRFP